MTAAARQLLDKALKKLTPKEQQKLAQDLLTGLYEPEDEGVEEAWAVEVRRRLELMDDGKAKFIPGDQAMREARERLQKVRRR